MHKNVDFDFQRVSPRFTTPTTQASHCHTTEDLIFKKLIKNYGARIEKNNI